MEPRTCLSSVQSSSHSSSHSGSQCGSHSSSHRGAIEEPGTEKGIKNVIVSIGLLFLDRDRRLLQYFLAKL